MCDGETEDDSGLDEWHLPVRYPRYQRYLIAEIAGWWPDKSLEFRREVTTGHRYFREIHSNEWTLTWEKDQVTRYERGWEKRK